MTKNKEWQEICEAYCKKIGAKLLFVNDFGFGYEKNERFVHINANELADALGIDAQGGRNG